MSAQPFDVGPIITRLRTRAISATGLRVVEGRGAYAQLRSLQDFPAPCAYVLLAAETAIRTDASQALPGQQTDIGQTVRVGIGIVMAFRNHRGLAADELRDELNAQVGAVRNHLLGWTPQVAGGQQLQLLGGDLEDYDASVALWTDRWQTQHFIQPEITP